MKQKVAQQIQKMEKKYNFKKRVSIAERSSMKIKTQPGIDQAIDYESKNYEKFDISRVFLSQSNDVTKATSSPSSERQNRSFIGKKYFDLKLYKAESQCRKFQTKKMSLNLPKLKPNFQTELYQEAHFHRLPKLNDEQKIKRRAMMKVDEIYACQQRIVNEKYQKIKRIKNRLKILDKIAFDKLRLKEEYSQLNKQ